MLEILAFVMFWQSRQGFGRGMALLARMMCIVSGLGALVFLRWSLP